ncbi:unnamed protein product, partial [Mesorhabditis belari]|uniref:Sulfotransferase domain-containing protein n=1 Tax=Mesorhabditis belari TaxID=2138241 RepID=A0AAF3F502_9BILA
MYRFPLHFLLYTCAILSLLALVEISFFYSNQKDEQQYEIHKYSMEDESAINESVDFELKKRRLPGCLIIGARKGGTRALLDALALHPMIRAARREVHFFDRNDTFSRGIAWYKDQMPLSFHHQLTIEKTPAYFPSFVTPERVFQMNSKMKIIVILREPVIRTISDYTQVYYNRLELKKSLPLFGEVVFRNGTDQIDTDYKPVRNSLYEIHLRSWLNYFPLSQIHIVDGDKFGIDPLPELRLVESFLNVPHLINSSSLVWDQRKGFFCFRKNQRQPPHCLGDSKGRTHRPVSSSTRENLRKAFLPYNERLFALIGRRFRW